MILKYQDIKKRRSRFVFDILKDANRETLNEILQNDPDIVNIEVKINGVVVPLTILEKMYKDFDGIIDYRAKHKALKIIEQLTPTFQDLVDNSVRTLDREIKTEIVNFSEDIQFAGKVDDIGKE